MTRIANLGTSFFSDSAEHGAPALNIWPAYDHGVSARKRRRLLPDVAQVELQTSFTVRRANKKVGRFATCSTSPAATSFHRSPTSTTPTSTSFAFCPQCDVEGLDPPRDVPMPACLVEGTLCKGEELKEAKRFIRGIHETIGTTLNQAAEARGKFERRACDFKIAEERGLTGLMEEYGKHGEKRPGGSYVWYLLQYRKALDGLKKACDKSFSCAELVNKLQGNEKLRPGGAAEVPLKFHLWAEMSKGCDLASKMAPVPNEQSAWCSPEGSDCEVKNCRLWWRGIHPVTTTSGLHGWKDDHPAYRLFDKFCRYLRRSDRVDSPLAEQWQQKQQMQDADRWRGEQCNPAQKLLGFCEDPMEVGSSATALCKLRTGGYCERGRVMPGGKMGLDPALFA
mmetsp:Transcript_18530/g.46243  ORF Transcript_18530/g.46243 Transcript_18530/m.46243 type:complete len:395 (+) Transcript_18530:157-1341(+)